MKIIIKNTQWDMENWLEQFFWEILDPIVNLLGLKWMVMGQYMILEGLWEGTNAENFKILIFQD